MKNKHTSSLSRRDRQALQKRRIKAIKLYQKGQTQYQIAKKLKVSFEAVSNWVEDFKKHGLDGLKSKGKPGQKPKLTQDDKRNIRRAILKGPKTAGYSTDLWTLERLKTLIKNIAKISYHPGHVWKIIVSLGFSCQRPETRAKERNERKIKEWRIKTFQVLKKMG